MEEFWRQLDQDMNANPKDERLVSIGKCFVTRYHREQKFRKFVFTKVQEVTIEKIKKCT